MTKEQKRKEMMSLMEDRDEIIEALEKIKQTLERLFSRARAANTTELVLLAMAQENDKLRYGLEKYRGQIDNEGKHSASDTLDNAKNNRSK